MSSILGAGQGLFHILQNVAGTIESALVPQSQADASGSAPAVPSPGYGPHHALMAKIEAAVTTALQSSQTNASADPNQVIQNAISQVLTANASSTQTAATTAQTPTDDGSTEATFLQTLRQFGIDPQQFHQDLVAALQSFKGGATGASIASLPFPSGSLLNTSA